MKKYIDLLTIGNLTPEVLKILAPLRVKYNIVSCIVDNYSASLIAEKSKLVLRQNDKTVLIGEDAVEPQYIEDYIYNAAIQLDSKALKNYYSVAINRNNVEKLPSLLNKLHLADTQSTCLLACPVSEFATVEELPEDIQMFIEVNCDKIVFIPVDIPYDFCRLIPAVKYMQDNDLDDETLIQVDLDADYFEDTFNKLYRLIAETEDFTITSAVTPNTLFDTPVLSNVLTAVKPRYFNDLLWKGLRPAIIANSPANYWHTFNLWASDVSRSTYYCKFDKTVSDDLTNYMTIKAFYNELARLGINKLLTEEVV